VIIGFSIVAAFIHKDLARRPAWRAGSTSLASAVSASGSIALPRTITRILAVQIVNDHHEAGGLLVAARTPLPFRRPPKASAFAACKIRPAPLKILSGELAKNAKTDQTTAQFNFSSTGGQIDARDNAEGQAETSKDQEAPRGGSQESKEAGEAEFERASREEGEGEEGKSEEGKDRDRKGGEGKVD
jgi:hypothetical protein